MSRIVMLSGSPSANSRSDHILKYLGKLVEKQDFEVSHISVRDIPQEDLFTGNYQSPAIQNIVANIENAQGIVIASPVYKGAYTGVLKALIDVLPQDILEHKPALPIMTGGSLSHLLAIEYALKPLVNILKGQCLKGVYFLDNQVTKNTTQPILDKELLDRTKKQLNYFIEIVHRQQFFVSLST